MAKFQIGDVEFPTKAAAKKAVSELISIYRVGNKIVNPQHVHLLEQLVATHPWGRNMTRLPIKHFEIFNHRTYRRTKQVHAVREDGSHVDLAITRYFAKSNPDAAGRFRTRAREGIADQIAEFRRRYFLVTTHPRCAITGVPISPENTHVDHIVPFEDMVLEWEQKTNSDYGVDSLNRFLRWHARYAKLRCVHKDVNMTRGRGHDERITD